MRTIITIGVGIALGIGGTLGAQQVLLRSETTAQVHVQAVLTCPEPPAAPDVPPNRNALAPIDTTYTPQGRALPMPRAGQR